MTCCRMPACDLLRVTYLGHAFFGLGGMALMRSATATRTMCPQNLFASAATSLSFSVTAMDIAYESVHIAYKNGNQIPMQALSGLAWDDTPKSAPGQLESKAGQGP